MKLSDGAKAMTDLGERKMVLVVRNDLAMGKGKIAAQVWLNCKEDYREKENKSLQSSLCVLAKLSYFMPGSQFFCIMLGVAYLLDYWLCMSIVKAGLNKLWDKRK